MRFDRVIRRIGRDLVRNDPGCAFEVLHRVGHRRFIDGLSKGFNWSVKVQFNGDLDDDRLRKYFVEAMLGVLIDNDVFPMCVAFYKSSDDEPYCDVFECMIDTSGYDYIWIYKLFDGPDTLVIAKEVPWQDFCDVRRMMCTDHDYFFWNVRAFCSGRWEYDAFSYLLGPYTALPKLPAAAA